MKHARSDYDRIQDPAGFIPEHEPVFLIRGQDAIGAAAVRAWAALNETIGGDHLLTVRARDHADRMDEWPVHKPADGPTEKNDD